MVVTAIKINKTIEFINITAFFYAVPIANVGSTAIFAPRLTNK